MVCFMYFFVYPRASICSLFSLFICEDSVLWAVEFLIK